MSHEVTDEMIRAGARVYLHEVFYPEDIAYEEWGKASELTRKVLEAALSASPTRAQAASAGEPVAWLKKWEDYVKRPNGFRKRLDFYPELDPWFEQMTNVQVIPLYAAPTDGRSPNDVAYREVTREDAEQALAQYATTNADIWTSSTGAMLAALRSIHAVIRTDSPGIVCPAGEKS